MKKKDYNYYRNRPRFGLIKKEEEDQRYLTKMKKSAYVFTI